MQKYTFEGIKDFLFNNYGYEYVSGEYNGINSLLTAKDTFGYMYLCNIQKMMYKKTKSKIVHTSNPYSIRNINNFLRLNANCEFICISERYVNNKTELEFKHLKCGRTIKNKWINISRGRYRDNVSQNKTGLFCEHCDAKHLESTHALVLKQVWLHEHTDTVVEDKSCANPKTGHVMPTDIVNHRLKIAIEIQSSFHDFKRQKEKDCIKSAFWLNNGYKFYNPDQREYTVLEMIKLFFPNINEIPSYIDLSYSNKFDDITAQALLNEHKSVRIVSEIMNCREHLIYDAIANGRISYPDDYTNNRFNQVVQLDLNYNYIDSFETISSAQKKTGVIGISYVLRHRRNYCGGYYWVRKSDYESGDYRIVETRLKNKKAQL